MPILNKITHLFFDLDGTLIDSSKGIYDAYKKSLINSFLDIKPVSQNIFKKYIGPPFEIMSKKIHPKLNDEENIRIVKIFREIYDSKYFLKYQVYANIKDCLEKLKKLNYFFYVLTNKRDLQAKVLVNKEFPNTFQEVFGKKDEFFKKELVLNDFRTKNKNVNIIYIGDTLNDMESAMKASVSFLFVSYGYGKIGNEYDIQTCNDSSTLKDEILNFNYYKTK